MRFAGRRAACGAALALSVGWLAAPVLAEVPVGTWAMTGRERATASVAGRTVTRRGDTAVDLVVALDGTWRVDLLPEPYSVTVRGTMTERENGRFAAEADVASLNGLSRALRDMAEDDGLHDPQTKRTTLRVRGRTLEDGTLRIRSVLRSTMTVRARGARMPMRLHVADRMTGARPD